jgi:hypothetical protein
LEGVITDGDVRPSRVEHPEILEPAGVVDVRQEILEELEVAFAIEDDHRNPAGVVRGADNAV